MNKTMRPVSVSTKDGLILLAQEDQHEVAITPEQAPLLIQWLQEAVQAIGIASPDKAKTDAQKALDAFENPPAASD